MFTDKASGKDIERPELDVLITFVRDGDTVFFNRLGKIRDRSFEQQRYRASGLNLSLLLSYFGTWFIWNGLLRF